MTFNLKELKQFDKIVCEETNIKNYQRTVSNELSLIYSLEENDYYWINKGQRHEIEDEKKLEKVLNHLNSITNVAIDNNKMYVQ